jgi:hypothetical protein
MPTVGCLVSLCGAISLPAALGIEKVETQAFQNRGSAGMSICLDVGEVLPPAVGEFDQQTPGELKGVEPSQWHGFGQRIGNTVRPGPAGRRGLEDAMPS